MLHRLTLGLSLLPVDCYSHDKGIEVISIEYALVGDPLVILDRPIFPDANENSMTSITLLSALFRMARDEDAITPFVKVEATVPVMDANLYPGTLTP